MGKGRSKRQRAQVRAARDPHVATLDELIEMIRQVNPSDRDLPAAEMARRYAQKSALQNVLIARFGEALEASFEDEGRVVLLRERASPRSAGHAPVEALDAEARRWLRAQADAQELARGTTVAETPAASRAGAAPEGGRASGRASDPERETLAAVPGEPDGDALPKDPVAVLALGQQALGAYDYPLAQRCFAAALLRSRGQLEPALLLLELLVDHLAAYDEAYALETQLSSETKRDARVRLLLALAAAQLGEADAALAYVAGSDDARAAEVFLLLATHALRSHESSALGDAGDDQQDDAIAGYLRQAQAVVAYDPRFDELAAALEARRAARRQPREAALRAYAEHGDREETERRARALLERWPDSVIARRLLSQLARERQAAQVAALDAQLGEALRRGGQHRAAELAGRLLELDPGHQLAAQTLARSEAERAARAEGAQVTAVQNLLQGDDQTAALSAYVALSAPLRERVRKENETPELRWLEQLDTSTTARARRAVAGAIALRSAQRALAEGDAARAVSLLAPKRKLLAAFDEARTLHDRACEQVERERAHEAEAALEALATALDGGDLPAAQQALAAATQPGLAAAHRRRLGELSQDLARQQATHALTERYREALQAQQHLVARASLEALIARAHDNGLERARWQLELETLRARTIAAWRVQVHQAPALEALMPDERFGARSGGPVWVRPGGRSLLLIDVLARWLFIRPVDLETGRVTCVVSMQLPDPMSKPEEAMVDRAGLWLEGSDGAQLTIDPDRWEPETWWDLTSHFGTSEIVEHSALLPNSRYVWLTSSRRDPFSEVTRVYDLDRQRVCRELAGGLFTRVLGLSLMIETGQEGRVYDARGVAVRPDFELPEATLDCIAMHPSGTGIVAAPAEAEEEEDLRRLFVALPEGSGRVRLDGGEDLVVRALASATDVGLTFAIVHEEERGSALIALRPRPKAQLELVYRLAVPPGTLLASDADATTVVAIARGSSRLQIARLTATPPAIRALDPAAERADRQGLPTLSDFWHCGLNDGPLAARKMALKGLLADVSRSALPGWVKRYRDEHAADPPALLALAGALRYRRYADDAGVILRQWTWDRHPDDPLVRLDHARARAEAGDWPAVRQQLASIDPTPWEGDAQHGCHLLGLAYFQAGDVEAAVASWLTGMRHEGTCELGALLELAAVFRTRTDIEQVQAHRARLDALRDPPPTLGLAARLAKAILAADRALAAGAAERAIALLDRHDLRAAAEQQHAARLAAAYLARAPAEPARELDKAVALARFCHFRGRDHYVRQLPLPSATWDEARLAQLEQQARAWLETCVLGLPPSPVG